MTPTPHAHSPHHDEEDSIVSLNENQPAVTDQDLEAMLEEAEATVTELREEITRRRREARESAQHAEIDRLEEHLRQARVQWSEVRGFLREALAAARRGETGWEGQK
ncbi:MAG: hypothetical protein Q4G34_10805 [Micrococcus sp.]|nr:hypothetical protein [Micrococcus sp.]